MLDRTRNWCRMILLTCGQRYKTLRVVRWWQTGVEWHGLENRCWIGWIWEIHVWKLWIGQTWQEEQRPCPKVHDSQAGLHHQTPQKVHSHTESQRHLHSLRQFFSFSGFSISRYWLRTVHTAVFLLLSGGFGILARVKDTRPAFVISVISQLFPSHVSRFQFLLGTGQRNARTMRMMTNDEWRVASDE